MHAASTSSAKPASSPAPAPSPVPVSGPGPGRPGPDEYASYYAGYIANVGDADVRAVLRAQLDGEIGFLRTVPEAQAGILHAPYTWTIKQVVGHLSDAERVFSYRALRFARGDATPLPGFEENAYALAAEFKSLPLRTLVEEYEIVRRSSLALFAGLSAESWLRRGEASGRPFSVRALAYAIAGHTRHHMRIIRARLTG